MPRIAGTTNAQTEFLRAFRNNPAGPPPEKWPSLSVLRRWLRRPAFGRALACMREVLHLRAQFHIAAAADQAAQMLAASTQETPLTAHQTKQLLDLIRLGFVQKRFAPQEPNLLVRGKKD